MRHLEPRARADAAKSAAPLSSTLGIILTTRNMRTIIMIEYRHNFPLSPIDVVRVFDASGITRPTKDVPRMFANANLIISAWPEGILVGVCRALTDSSYCCCLSDLAVDRAFQKHGIGKEPIRRVEATIGEEASLVLLSSSGAMS
jgi:Acetyltransferase (GNAT) family